MLPDDTTPTPAEEQEAVWFRIRRILSRYKPVSALMLMLQYLQESMTEVQRKAFYEWLRQRNDDRIERARDSLQAQREDPEA